MEDEQQQRRRKMEEELRRIPNCPRCNSGHTKSASYHNYSIAEPRYFCRTCHRYWTNGGIVQGALGGVCSTKRSKTNAPPSGSISAADLEFAIANAPLRVPRLMPETLQDLNAMRLHPLVHDMIGGSIEANANAPPPAPGSKPARHYYGLTIDELMRDPEFMASLNSSVKGTPKDRGTPAQQQNDAPPPTETSADAPAADAPAADVPAADAPAADSPADDAPAADALATDAPAADAPATDAPADDDPAADAQAADAPAADAPVADALTDDVPTTAAAPASSSGVSKIKEEEDGKKME